MELRNCPWTDGKGSQEKYAESIHLWSLYHDKLHAGNSNAITKTLRGLTLKAPLFDRAADLCRDVPETVLLSDTGADATVKALYKGAA